MNISNNIYDFVEIGTSDFDTEIQKATDITKGLSIEPVIYYLNRLPNKLNVKKLNCAITDFNGFIDFYHVPVENFGKSKNLRLPCWAKGCNTVNQYHHTIEKLILDKNLDPDEFFVKTVVEAKTLYTCLLEEKVETIKLLKIDTEGHDCVILKKFAEEIINNNSYYLLPEIIKFESNTLTNKKDVNEIKEIYINLNYYVKFSGGDTILQKK
tara:strand:+ start:325 stop:957 length:633 start_codon:yes stop_codon:yes gene_type:complete